MQVFTDDAELIAAGAQSYRLASHAWFFAKNASGVYSTARVDLSVVEAMIDKYSGETTPLLLDIEAYDFATDFANGVRQLRVAAEAWRAGSKRPIGFYSTPIYRRTSWFTPIRWWEAVESGHVHQHRANMAAWRAINTRTAEALVDLVDFLVPAVYAVYPDKWQQWRAYAEIVCDEAARVARGKPVYPIMCPTVTNKYNSAVSSVEWESCVQWIATHPAVAGLMIFYAGSAAADDWREALKALTATAGHEVHE
jgi:hypothetical protein